MAKPYIPSQDSELDLYGIIRKELWPCKVPGVAKKEGGKIYRLDCWCSPLLQLQRTPPQDLSPIYAVRAHVVVVELLQGAERIQEDTAQNEGRH